jgi:AraC-like DNA-binding protein
VESAKSARGNIPAVSIEQLDLQIKHRPLINGPSMDWSYGNRIFTDYDLFMGYSGNARIRLDNQLFVLEPGCILLVPPNKEISIDASNKPTPTSIAQHFTLNVFGEVDFFSLFDYHNMVRLDPGHEMFVLYRRYVEVYDSPLFQVIGKALFLYILFSFLDTAYISDRFESSRHHTVIQLLSLLESHSLDADVLERFMKKSPYSAGHTIQLFKSFLGKTPRQYVQDKRMTHARNLLIQGHSVTETAHACLFEDEFYFSRAFKLNVGMSPREFRRSVLSDRV